MSEELKRALILCGVDLEETLRRFGGQELLYAKFLMKFSDDKSYADLISAVLAHNAEEAYAAAHTLKGVSANLGLEDIYKTVSGVVEICREREIDERVRDLMEQLAAHYERLLQALRSESKK